MEKIVEYWDEEKTKIKFEFFLNENGELEGFAVLYYENGNPWFETNWKNGKFDGLWKSYYPNNNLMYEINYKEGKYDGLWKWYYPNGNLKHEANYKDDKCVGSDKFYDEDGTLMYKELHILESIKNIIKTLLLNLKKIIKR